MQMELSEKPWEHLAFLICILISIPPSSCTLSSQLPGPSCCCLEHKALNESSSESALCQHRFLCLMPPETLFPMSVPYSPEIQRGLGFTPRVLHVTPLFLSPPQRGTPSVWFALKNVGLEKSVPLDLTNPLLQHRKPSR